MEQNTGLKIGQPVLLTWVDSSSHPGWIYGKTLLTIGTIRSAGLVVENTREQLTIAIAINDEGSRHSELAIPYSCITALEPIVQTK